MTHTPTRSSVTAVLRNKAGLFMLCAAATGVVSASARAQGEASRAWTTYKGSAQRTGFVAAPLKLPLNLQWRYTVTLPLDNPTPDVNSTSPLIAGPPDARRAFFVFGKTLYGVETDSGALAWNKTAALTSRVSAPLALLSSSDGDYILIADGDGVLSARRTTDGSEVWRADAGAPIRVAPVVFSTARGVRIAVFTDTGRAVAYDTSGKADPQWSFPLGRGNAAPTSSPVVSADGKTMYVATDDQSLHIINTATGRITKSAPVGAAVDGTPALFGDRMIVNTGDSVRALDSRTGRALWTTPMTLQGGVAKGSPSGNIQNGKGTVFIGTDRNSLLALDGKTGKILWQADLKAQVTGTPLVTPSAVVVGTRNGMLYSVDAQNGSVQWSYRLRAEREQMARARNTNSNRNNSSGTGSGNTRNNNRNNSSGGTGNTRGGNTRGSGRNTGSTAVGGNTGAGVGAMETVVYGVSSAPAFVDGQVFVLANNAALYAFGESAFDAQPPRLLQPTITINSREGDQYPQLISDTGELTIQGRAPVFFAAEIDDVGSGIDPSSIRVLVNGTEVPAENIEFKVNSGIVTAALARSKGGTSNNLDDGQAELVVTARDWRGNTMLYNGNFSVDNNMEAPSSESIGGTRPGAMPGGFGGAMPGMTPGAMPGMAPGTMPGTTQGTAPGAAGGFGMPSPTGSMPVLGSDSED